MRVPVPRLWWDSPSHEPVSAWRRTANFSVFMSCAPTMIPSRSTAISAVQFSGENAAHVR